MLVFPQTESKPDFSNIKIENFGQMDERFYRGAQPDQDDFKSLADLGIQRLLTYGMVRGILKKKRLNRSV